MYRAVQYAFDRAGIPWLSCRHEDRGDGVLILAPADVAKALFVDRLPDALVDALLKHNKIHPAEERIRLRLALHAGEINYDSHGVTGSSITHTFRLLNADSLRSALAESPAVLAVIGSAWFFDEVIRHSECSNAKAFRPADVTNKETTTQAWIRLLKGRVIGRS
jgi:class 3 adenylate cyclase